MDKGRRLDHKERRPVRALTHAAGGSGGSRREYWSADLQAGFAV